MTETAGPRDTLERLGPLLDRAVRALGDAGEADAAARIAAEAWWLLRGPSPRCARRLNATLHYLTLTPTKKESHVHQR
ncbi:MAG TPA: hypothetical protein VIL98_06385 [Gaiellaceae bacterium]